MNNDNLYQIKKALQEVGRFYRIPWKILMSMAIIETGGGEHFPKGRDGESSYNFLGIKWNKVMSEFAGGNVLTQEHIDGDIVTIRDQFVSYVNFFHCALHACRIIRFGKNFVAAREMIDALCNGKGQDADGLDVVRVILESIASKWSTDLDYAIKCERLWNEERFRCYLYE